MLEQIPATIRNQISTALSVTIKTFHVVSGGCINNGGRLETDKGSFFLKWNDAKKFPEMFEAESRGLKMLAEASAIRIPKVVLAGAADDFQFLLLEFISAGASKKMFWRMLGEQLSELHCKGSAQFGLDFDNYIGSLAQRNTKHDNWTSFFIEERLKPQVALCAGSHALPSREINRFEQLYKKLPSLIVEEKPALLHGDLWSGNVIPDEKGHPCLIDPAIFYGHREAEIAFTKLFGGFSHEFYDSYNSVSPLEKGYESRIDLYNLYPLLVHVNLFGGSYGRQVVSILSHYV